MRRYDVMSRGHNRQVVLTVCDELQFFKYFKNILIVEVSVVLAFVYARRLK